MEIAEERHSNVGTRSKSADNIFKTDTSNAAKRRELPPRRPCRRNQSDTPPATPASPKQEKLKQEEEVALYHTSQPGPPPAHPPSSMSTAFYQTNHGQYIAFTQGAPIQIPPEGMQGMAMPNTGRVAPSAPMVQYPGQSGDGAPPQYYRPAATGDMSAYQLRGPASSLPQGVVMATAPPIQRSSHHSAEDATRKREIRLMKNREAAKECRRRKREYVRCLETRLSMVEAQNKKLLSDLQYVQEVYGIKVSEQDSHPA
ncbi:cAMP-responsive element modulator-like [Aplochiton taeniatus]